MGKSKAADAEQALMSPLDRVRNNTKDLREMTWEQLEAMANELPGDEALDASQLGDGFVLLESAKDKKHLVGVPFAIIDWDEWASKQYPGSYFASMVIKTAHPIPQLDNNQHFRVNDGSTGIYRQLRQMKQNGFTGMIICRNGLRISEDYVVTQPAYDDRGNPILDEVTGKPKQEPKLDPMTGKEIRGTTFYLDAGL